MSVEDTRRVAVMGFVQDLQPHAVATQTAMIWKTAVQILTVCAPLVSKHTHSLVANFHNPFLSRTVPPNLPTSIEVTEITHIAASIEWTVVSIVFSAETYTLVYSTTLDDLDTVTGEQKFSGTDLSQTDKTYFVKLDGLSAGTIYYYQIKIENTVGVIVTEVFTFETRTLLSVL